MDGILSTINSICRLVLGFTVIYYITVIIDTIKEKKKNKGKETDKEKTKHNKLGKYDNLLFIVMLISLVYVPWYYNSVVLEEIPEGSYTVKAAVMETNSDKYAQSSTAKIRIDRELDFEDYDDYAGVTHTRTTVYEDVYLESFVYNGKRYVLDEDEELVLGKPMEIEFWDEDKEFSVEICSEKLDLNTVGLTKKDVRAQSSMLRQIFYYAELLCAAVYVIYHIKEKFMDRDTE